MEDVIEAVQRLATSEVGCFQQLPALLLQRSQAALTTLRYQKLLLRLQLMARHWLRTALSPLGDYEATERAVKRLTARWRRQLPGYVSPPETPPETSRAPTVASVASRVATVTSVATPPGTPPESPRALSRARSEEALPAAPLRLRSASGILDNRRRGVT